jgi:hypothetical protein
MTDEAILGVIGAAISIAQLVSLLSEQTPKRGKIVAWLTIAIVVLGGAIWYKQEWQYDQLVQRTKREVLGSLAKPKTFDQLLDDLYYPSYSTLEDAIDQMIEERTIEQRRLFAVSKGDTLEVRVYASPKGSAFQQSGKRPE